VFSLPGSQRLIHPGFGQVTARNSPDSSSKSQSCYPSRLFRCASGDLPRVACAWQAHDGSCQRRFPVVPRYRTRGEPQPAGGKSQRRATALVSRKAQSLLAVPRPTPPLRARTEPSAVSMRITPENGSASTRDPGRTWPCLPSRVTALQTAKPYLSHDK
jgi:hypothetical protein